MRKLFDKSESQFVNSESTNNKQNLSSRINEVHCGILKTLKRYRNSFYSCGMTLANSLFTTHKRQLTKFAFTLAETLVVMGIIGVVAALTIPNLNQSTGDREKVARVKKAYSNLNDAFGRATAVYGPIEEWFINDNTNSAYSARVATRVADFLKISKNCEFEEEGCMASSYSYLTTANTISLNSFYKILLADGMAFSFLMSSKDCSNSDYALSSDSPIAKVCGFVRVDIDGSKGVNTNGKDLFGFYITAEGIYPWGGQNTVEAEGADALVEHCFSDGMDCAGWVIETGNMDYLKANAGVCPNGTELNWENTSCK